MRAQLANAVTSIRVLLVVPFWIAFGSPGIAPAIAAVACAFFMELSDLLDGAVARKLGVVSEVGKLLDPAADSFSRLSVFLCLATGPGPGGRPLEHWFPAWAVVALLFRDVGVSFIRQVCAARGVVVAARSTGKLKAVVQGGAIWAILAMHVHVLATGDHPTYSSVAFWLSLVVVGVTLASLVDYARALVERGASRAAA